MAATVLVAMDAEMAEVLEGLLLAEAQRALYESGLYHFKPLYPLDRGAAARQLYRYASIMRIAARGHSEPA